MIPLTTVDERDLKKAFDVHTAEGDSSISKASFTKIMQKAGYAIGNDPSLLDTAFGLFGINTC
jgi:Ca2+-binding EF-hand superfamily protein